MTGDDQGFSRPCPCCEGVGCEECDGTGQRVATFIDFDGGTMRVNGSAVLSSEDVAALQALGKAVYDYSRANPNRSGEDA